MHLINKKCRPGETELRLTCLLLFKKVYTIGIPKLNSNMYLKGMDPECRYIIDYNTGDMWQTTVELFNHYETYCLSIVQGSKLVAQPYSTFTLWFASLSVDDQQKLVRK